MPEVIEVDGQTTETKHSVQIKRSAQEVNHLLFSIAEHTVQPHVREKCKEMIYFLSSEYPIPGFCEACDSFPESECSSIPGDQARQP